MMLKVKVKFNREQAMKAQRGSGSVALLFLSPQYQMGLGGQCHALAGLRLGKRPGTHSTGS
jgi:hypothetical protein